MSSHPDMTHTHTHTHTHNVFYTNRGTITISISLTLTLSLNHSLLHSYTHSLFLSLSPFLFHTLAHLRISPTQIPFKNIETILAQKCSCIRMWQKCMETCFVHHALFKNQTFDLPLRINVIKEAVLSDCS